MKCKKLVRAIIAFAVAGSMSMTVNATSISDLKDQKDQKESKKEEAEAVLAQRTEFDSGCDCRTGCAGNGIYK